MLCIGQLPVVLCCGGRTHPGQHLSPHLHRTHLNAVQNIELACEGVETPLQRLEHGLQSWIAYMVLPLFALANAGLALGELNPTAAFLHPVTVGWVILRLARQKTDRAGGATHRRPEF